jgi:hypothetical protein
VRLPPLPMTCTIARLPGTYDTFGEPNAAAAVASGVPCYWWSSDLSSRISNSNVPGIVATETEHLLLAPGTDIQQGDQITTVSDHLGNVVFAATDYRVVEHVTIQRNHLDCTLRYGEVVGGRT